MITRIEIDGFKSLREFAVDLEPLTVFIGPNSAGKSNILDALALLARLSSMSIEEAFKQGRGRAIDQFTRRGGEAGTTIRFAVEVLAPSIFAESADALEFPNRYRYELVVERRRVATGVERLVVKDESLRAIEQDVDTWSKSHPQFSKHAARATGAFDLFDHFEPNRRDSSATSAHITRLRLFELRAREKRIESILDGTAHTVRSSIAEQDGAMTVATELRAYRLVHLDSASLRDPSERIGSDTLASDASNLPTVLANLSGPTLGAIRADLVSLVPGISSFEVVPEGDDFRIDFELSGGERLPARLVSDGTLRILALLTALRAEPRPSAIGIEELENGVYPGRLRKLLDYLEACAAPAGEGGAFPTQLILTTHSPVVLAALRSRPEHLRFVDLVRRDGQLVTRARTVGATTGPDRGRHTVSLREIDELLHAADSEIGQ